MLNRLKKENTGRRAWWSQFNIGVIFLSRVLALNTRNLVWIRGPLAL